MLFFVFGFWLICKILRYGLWLCLVLLSCDVCLRWSSCLVSFFRWILECSCFGGVCLCLRVNFGELLVIFSCCLRVCFWFLWLMCGVFWLMFILWWVSWILWFRFLKDRSWRMCVCWCFLVRFIFVMDVLMMFWVYLRCLFSEFLIVNSWCWLMIEWRFYWCMVSIWLLWCVMWRCCCFLKWELRLIFVISLVGRFLVRCLLLVVVVLRLKRCWWCLFNLIWWKLRFFLIKCSVIWRIWWVVNWESWCSFWLVEVWIVFWNVFSVRFRFCYRICVFCFFWVGFI